MDNNALKLGNNADVQEINPGVKTPETAREVIEAKESIARNIDQAAEDASEGQFSEQNKKDSGKYTTQAANDNAVSVDTRVKALPSVAVMKEQTITAIEAELARTQEEIKAALSSKIVPFELNEKVRRARFLNGLLGELKRAVKLAEDFVVNLWKQYVQEKKN